MLGLMDRAAGYINTIKDLGACVRRAYELDKGLGARITDLVNQANVAGRGLHGTLGIAKRMVNEAHVVHHPSDLKEAQEQADLIARMTQVIHQVGVEARSLKSINPAMSAEVARALRGGTRTAVRSLYKWRKTIEEYTQEAEEREALNGQHHEERDQQADVQ